MRKRFSIQLISLVVYFLLITIIKRWYSPVFISFWIGGLVGLFMPYLDYLVYMYFIAPQKVKGNIELSGKSLLKKISFLAKDASLNPKLIFNTAHFYLILILLTFLVITSSGSLFGRGLVLSFLLSLYVFQVREFMRLGGINRWFEKLNITMDRERQLWYLGFNALMLLVFGIYF